LTGTPIQNRLSDLANLLHFLRAHPYDDTTTFETHITEPWKRGNEEVAIDRLKRLFTTIALRRPKSIVELPARRDVRRTLEFTQIELTQYRELEASIATVLEEAISTGKYTPGLYANALQRINRLRMFCNLGMFSNTSKDERNSVPQDQWNATIAQEYLNDLVTVGSAKCDKCCTDLESLSQTEYDQSQETYPDGRLFKCMVLLCYQCYQDQKKKRSSRCFSCGGSPPCSSASVSASCSFSAPVQRELSIELPTKIRTLIEDILGLPQSSKR
jgi:SNF2 family DNA or RNA helicase